MGTINHGAGIVITLECTCMSKNIVDTVVRVTGRMNSNNYISVLEDAMILSAWYIKGSLCAHA